MTRDIAHHKLYGIAAKWSALIISKPTISSLVAQFDGKAGVIIGDNRLSTTAG